MSHCLDAIQIEDSCDDRNDDYAVLDDLTKHINKSQKPLLEAL